MSELIARGTRAALVVGGSLLLLLALTTRLRAQVTDPVSVVRAYYAALEKNNFEVALGLIENPSMSARTLVDHLGDIVSAAFSLRPPLPQTALRACESNLKNMGTALEMYSTDYNGRYPLQVAKLTPNYLRVMPTCPAAGADTYTASFRSASNPDAYTVYCSGTHHAADGLSANHPEYNSTTGLEIGASSAKPEVLPLPFKLVSARVVGSRIGDNKATVEVLEEYTVFDYPARVFSTYPLVRGKDGWRIDGVAMATSESPIPALVGNKMGRFNWLRIHGLGVMVASAAGYYETPQGKKLMPQREADSCGSNLKNYGTALEMYSTDNGGRYPTSTAALEPNYFKTLPTCPTARADTYAGSYQCSMAPDAYTVFCKGNFHAAAGLEANFPCYTSTKGLLMKKEAR